MRPEKYHILFVDDEENNLIAFKNAFFRAYTIFTATSVMNALDILEKNPIQLVVTDQRMPFITGIQFLRIVKEKYPQIISIIVTGYSDVEIIIQAFNELDIFHYSLKPWNNYDLKIIIDNALTKYQLTSENTLLINELKKANETLEEKIKLRTADLEQKSKEYAELNQVKDKLFSIISHDLRAPLASLTSFLNISLQYKDAFSPEENHRAMLDIQNSLINLTEMLNNLLHWARAQIGNTDPVIEICSIHEIIEKTFHQYQDIAAQKNIILQMDLPEKDFLVDIDENMTGLILRNLIANAIKFTPAKGQIKLSFEHSDTYVAISVTDTGVGIPDEIANNLFSEKYLYSSLGTAGEKGTGIGLRLCKEYVEKQGGKISVKSKLKQGTIFSFTVPLTKLS